MSASPVARTALSAGLLLSCLAAGALGREALPRSDGNTALRLIDAHGRPVAGRDDIEVYRLVPGHDYVASKWTGSTDEEGRIRFDLPFGAWRMIFRVPRTGLVSSGTLVSRGKGRISAELPWLEPFGRIEGRIEGEPPWPELVSSAAHVWDRWTAEVDEAGRFVIENVPVGGVHIGLWGGKGFEPLTVEVPPGKTVTGVVVKRLDPAEEPEPLSLGFDRNAVADISGTVRDARGEPVAGARVFLVNKYHGGMRMYEKDRETTADERGAYAFEKVITHCACTALMAHSEGRPLAFGYARSRREPRLRARKGDEEEPDPERIRVDLVLPDTGASMEVTVLYRGKPGAGVLVTAVPEDWGRFFSPGWARQTSREARDRWMDLLSPIKKTGKAGKVRFDRLPPGSYRVVAMAHGEPRALRLIQGGYGTHVVWPPKADLAGFTASRGTCRRYTVSLVPSLGETAVRLLPVEGRPVPRGNIEMGWMRPTESRGTRCSCGANHLARSTIHAAGGFWRIRPRFSRYTELVRSEPLWEGEAVVALTSLYSRKRRVPVFLSELRPGSVEVRVRDVSGRPLRSCVTLSGFAGPAFESYPASTDLEGLVRFEGLSSGEYCLHVSRFERDVGIPVTVDSPDSDLAGRTAFGAGTEKIELGSGERRTVTVAEHALGWVRGVIHLPGGKAVGRHLVFASDARSNRACVYIHPESGRYLCGAACPGKGKLTIVHEESRSLDGTDRSTVHDILFVAGEVRRQDIRVEPGDIGPPRKEDWAFPSGEIVLCDGKTPAHAARVMLFAPGRKQALTGAWTDPAGRFSAHSIGEHGFGGWRDDPSTPSRPILVAWLPGHCGAAWREGPLGESNRLVLPPPIHLSGTVALPDIEQRQRGMRVRVLARFHGKGLPEGPADVECFADADGSFTLFGLTPGPYAVQAALEDIWISRPVVLAVPAEPERRLALACPPPGGPVELHLADAKGRPVPFAEMAFPSPSGPLADRFLPKTLRGAKNGILRVEGLPAGRAEVEFRGFQGRYALDIPPLPPDDADEVPVRELTLTR